MSTSVIMTHYVQKSICDSPRSLMKLELLPCVGTLFIVGSWIIKTVFTKNIDHRYLNLSSIIDILNHSKSFCFFVGLTLFVVHTVLFSRVWVSSSYFFIENPPSHIDFGVFLKLLQRRVQNPHKHLRLSFSLCS